MIVHLASREFVQAGAKAAKVARPTLTDKGTTIVQVPSKGPLVVMSTKR